MHILITGGQGYIGNYLVESLLEKGYYITTLDTGFTSKPYNFNCPVRRFQATINDADSVVRALDGVDVIYHLAGRMDFENSYRHPYRLVHTNVAGTANLLCMANRVGVDKVVFTSSAAVYGNIVGAKETDSTVPVDMYGATKLAAEAICKGFYQKGMEIIIFRLYNVWGRRNSCSVVNKFANGYDKIYGDGQQTRDFVHISDVLQALLMGLDLDSAIYNVGTEEETSINALFEKINPGKQPKYEDFRIGYSEPRRSCADTSTLKQFGWKPTIKLSDLSNKQIISMCNED